MREGLDLQPEASRMVAKRLYLAQGQLARQRDSRKSQIGQGRYAVLGMDAHLGGCMQPRIGELPDKGDGKPQVLHDERICAAGEALARKLDGPRHLFGQHDGVHGDVQARATQMRVVAGLGERDLVEVVGGAAGVQFAHAEIGRIGPGRDDGVQHGRAARRR